MDGLHLFDEKTPDQDNEPIELISFYSGSDLFCTDMRHVREIIEEPECKAIPHAEPYFIGLFNLRGEVAGLIDLRKKFGHAETKVHGKRPAILFSTDQGILGMIVDRMHRVTTIHRSAIKKNVAIRSSVSQEYIEGVIDYQGDIAILVNLPKLLNDDDIISFSTENVA